MLWTTAGLTIAAATGIMSMVVLYGLASAGVTMVFSPWVQLPVILGGWGIANYLAPRLVFGSQKVLGFVIGVFFQGITFGYLLLAAVTMGIQMGSPFGLLGSALGLTGLTGVGLTAYVWASPKKFRMLEAALSALSLPMLALMAVSFIFPSLFGGTVGLLLSVVFVVVSAAGLLYQINVVLHRLKTNQHVEGSYMITLGILILYWNILTLLMRLSRR